MKRKNIVLIHGWGASVEKLKPLGRELAKLGWKVMIPKLPGFDAKAPKIPWNLDDYVRYTSKQFKLKFKKEKVIVFGHSFGGGVAIKLGLMKDKQIAGLVLCATRGISRTNIIKRSVFWVLAKVGKMFLVVMPLAKVWKKFLYKLAREHDYEKTKGVMRQTFQNIVSERLKSQVKNIKKPTLILWGNEDKMVPAKDAHYLKSKIKSSKLKIYENQGHKLPYERPAELAKEIDTWSKSLKF